MKLFTEKHKNQFGDYDITFHATGWIAIVAVVCCIIAVCMVGCPSYNAKANLEAEKLNAQAEIERAKGAAEAIRIENGSITSTYIQYLWVRQQNNIPNKVVYIPTEANLPILEAKK